MASSMLHFALLATVASKCPTPEENMQNLTVDYDAQAHPGLMTSESVTVKVMLYIMSLVSVDQKEQQMEVHGFYRTQWVDQRLAMAERFKGCDLVTLPLSSLGSPIWQPDIYFDNSVSEWYGLGSVTLYPQGQVFRTQRFFHRFVCPMTFTRLPFDHQHCTIKMGSYSFGVKDLNITSYDAGGVALPSDYKGNEEFLVTSATSKVMLEVYDGTGEESGYSYLIIQLTLSRLSDCFMWFVVVTGVLFILVTYSGLFIDRKVAPARVAMAVIPVLIMLNLETSVRDSLPPLNTSTWLTGIIFLMKAFCLSAVFEYGVVSYLLQQETVHAEKFLAFKQLAAMIKRKEGQSSSKQLEFPVPSGKEVELVKPQLHQFPEGPNFLDITPVIESETPVALNSDSRCISRRSRTVAHAESMMMLEKSFAEAWRFFDLDNSGKLDQREVQVGFRRLGQYWSHRQVSAIFTELGIGDRDTMNKQDFKTFFMDVENYLPPKLQCSFWEQPPSLQVDKAFRWLYLIAMICGTVTYVVGYFIGDTQLTTKMD
eukprot:symbB.v1.2.036773.t1/scaffold5270.1/size29095/2